MRFRDILSVWDRIWFQPASPAPVCMFRLVFGWLVFIGCIMLGPDLMSFYGPHPLSTIETIKAYEHTPRFSLLFYGPNTPEFVWFLYAVMTMSALFVALGLFTRVSVITLFLCIVSFHHRNPALLNSGDTFTSEVGPDLRANFLSC